MISKKKRTLSPSSTKGYSACRLFRDSRGSNKYGEKRLWGGHLWSCGYFFRSVGSITGEAVEFYIKITQDKHLKEKYYTVVGSTDQNTTTEDPRIKSSGNGQKCYNIMVTGKVQDIGFRALIENAGRLFDLSGLVFNARDGSFRIVCCGEESITL